MNIPRGGWSGGQSDATPASQYDIRYGENLLKEESGSWSSYFIVTSPSAFEATRPLLSSSPTGFTFVNTLDWNQLDEISSSVPKGTMLIVAIGGGIVLDAAKLVVDYKQASVSLLQRKFRIGYSRAGRLIDELET